MKVNNEELKGIAIIDENDGIIAYISDEGVYFKRGCKIELVPPDMEVYIDQEKGTYDIQKVANEEVEKSEYLS